MNETLPRVRIIHTGGTIASKVDYKTGAVIAKFEPTEIVASILELANIANIDAEKMGNMFSDDIRPQHWNEIAKATQRAFDDGCHGVVITHGTDTLHISSAAMCFAWSGKGERPPGPIVMVGSQGHQIEALLTLVKTSLPQLNGQQRDLSQVENVEILL